MYSHGSHTLLEGVCVATTPLEHCWVECVYACLLPSSSPVMNMCPKNASKNSEQLFYAFIVSLFLKIQ